MTDAATQRVEYTSLTPSGLEILYSPKPRRLYELRNIRDSSWTYETWREVPSVSTIVGFLDHPPVWWGMQVGVEGVLELGELGLVRGWTETLHAFDQENAYWAKATEQNVVELLKKHKLTTNDARDRGGDRGTAVHDALELWAETGKTPDSTLFPIEQAGYVYGLSEFLRHLPSAEPIASEVMVGSLEHSFAGRYDLRIRTTEPHQIVRHRTPVRGPQWATLQPGEILLDLKTSKKTSVKHHVQLAGYELASIECGYGPTEHRGVLRVAADGTYVFVRSRATAEHFLAVRKTYDVIQELK